MVDLFSKFDPLIEQRETLLKTGLTDPFNLVMEKVESPTVAICNGRRTILLGTYNYMGMTFDPDVVAAGKQALDDFGSGTTGSRVLNGTYTGHKAVEQIKSVAEQQNRSVKSLEEAIENIDIGGVTLLRAAGKTTAIIGTIEYHLAGRVLPAVNTTPESLDLVRMLAEMR